MWRVQTASPERIQKVREFKLCYNCFSGNHQNLVQNADVSIILYYTYRPLEHHLLLNQINQNFGACDSTSQSFYMLLATARIYVYDITGNKYECRLLLDQGSQLHIMSTGLGKKLDFAYKLVGSTSSGIELGNESVLYQTTAKMSSRITNFLYDNKLFSTYFSIFQHVRNSTQAALGRNVYSTQYLKIDWLPIVEEKSY